MNVSQAKVAKILSSYHLRIDHSVQDAGDAEVAVKCDSGWVINDQHRSFIKSAWFDDPGYLCGYFKANVKPCHCPSCMQSDDWVHELPYLRDQLEDVISKLGIVSHKWDPNNHTLSGYFVCEGYDEAKPVFIQWEQSLQGSVRALVAMNNWDSVNECQREPIKRRLVMAPSTNSLLSALMGIRGDMHTPVPYRAEDLDSEACEALGAACASQFAREYVFRDLNSNSARALNRRDERRVRTNEIWWASMYEPDDVMRQLKAEQAKYQRDVLRFSEGNFID